MLSGCYTVLKEDMGKITDIPTFGFSAQFKNVCACLKSDSETYKRGQIRQLLKAVESQFLGDYTRPSLEMLCNETQSMNASQTNASQTNDLSVVCCASFDTCEALSDDGKQIAYTMRGMVLAEDDET